MNAEEMDQFLARQREAFVSRMAVSEVPKVKRTPWIQSYSGKVVTPGDLKVEQVTFADIPHALAQKVRFTGHLREMGYSVAQHSCIGSDQIAGPFKAAFLMHDVTETYLPDVASPMKQLLSITRAGLELMWEDLEEEHAKVIFEALGHSSLLPLIYSPEVKLMDLQMLMTEKRDLMGPEPEPWSIDVAPLEITLGGQVWNATRAKQEFITRYERLFGRGA